MYKEDDTETLGLIGLNRRAAIVEINVQQFFAQKNDTVPTMDYFKTLTTNNSSNPPTPRAAHLTQLPIPHSIALPPRSCDWLSSLHDLTVHSAYDRVLRECIFHDTEQRPRQRRIADGLPNPPEINPEEISYEMTQAFLPLLQTLYSWRRHKSQRKAAYTHAKSSFSDDYGTHMDKLLRSGDIYFGINPNNKPIYEGAEETKESEVDAEVITPRQTNTERTNNQNVSFSSITANTSD